MLVYNSYQKHSLIFYFASFLTLNLTFLSCNNKEPKDWKTPVKSTSEKHYQQPTKFLEFLNQYEKDSLNTILADDFYYISLNTNSDSIDKQTFLGERLKRIKVFHGEYNLLKILSKTEPEVFLVEDRSDYLKLLNVDFPIWKITIKKDINSKIKQVIQDTTGNFEKYCAAIQSKEEVFKNWLKIKYPKETLMELHENDSLLLERMKQYARQN